MPAILLASPPSFWTMRRLCFYEAYLFAVYFSQTTASFFWSSNRLILVAQYFFTLNIYEMGFWRSLGHPHSWKYLLAIPNHRPHNMDKVNM